jgi:hypothetical protein
MAVTLWADSSRAQTALLEPATPWRAFVVSASKGRTPKTGPNLTALPPADWTEAEFDDGSWGRCSLSDLLAFFGKRDNRSVPLHRLCLRTRFGIVDPAQTQEVALKLRHGGKAAVYVNGNQIADSAADGSQTTVKIPSASLRKGANVLAVDLSEASGSVVLGALGLTSSSDAGVTAYASAAKGAVVWSATPLDVVARAPGEPQQGFLIFGLSVTPWSDRHFALIERSLGEMAGLGTDLLYVPVIHGENHNTKTGLIRWVKKGNGYEPDFSAFERYLDLQIRVYGKPKVVTLSIWKKVFDSRPLQTVVDFWPMTRKSTGKWEDYYTAGDGWLFRSLVKRLTAPGPDGAVRTVQGQMLLESVQETEAIVALIRGKQTAPPERAARIAAWLTQRQQAKTAGLVLPFAMASQDLDGLSAGLYALAAELGGETGDGDWHQPPGTRKNAPRPNP